MSQTSDLLFFSASLFAVAIGAAACAREPRTAEPAGVTRTTAARREPPSADASAGDGAVIVGRDVLLACDLPDEPGEAPLFDFDGARLEPRGDDILTRVATCAVSGRLGDAKLKIVGYTDPRGPAEYNRQLGLYRAEAARQALRELGVAADRLVVESRGERDAKGTDEASWRLDRRVEVHLEGTTSDGGTSSSP